MPAPVLRRAAAQDQLLRREGWDHAQVWLPDGVALTGLEPRFIVAELTLADVTPAMADLRDLAASSLKAAESEVDGLWAASVVA